MLVTGDKAMLTVQQGTVDEKFENEADTVTKGKTTDSADHDPRLLP